jgi:hypothetical protein
LTWYYIVCLSLALSNLNIWRPKLVCTTKWFPYIFGFLRGVVFGLAGGLLIDPLFGLVFGFLSATGLIAVYAFRLSPTNAYQPNVKPRLRPRESIASAMRGTATALAGMIAALLTHSGSSAFVFGLTFGIVAGTVSAIVCVFSPFVEWRADHLPARRLGAFGTVILLIGLLLQSIQYWVVLLNVVVQRVMVATFHYSRTTRSTLKATCISFIERIAFQMPGR